VVFVPEG